MDRVKSLFVMATRCTWSQFQSQSKYRSRNTAYWRYLHSRTM